MVTPTGEAYVGSIKSLRGQHGFISCDLTHAAYGQDVFTSVANTGSLGVGSLVCFELVLNGKGQPQARNCRMVRPDPLGASASPSAKQEPLGKAYNGKIKMVMDKHSFIECQEVKLEWGNDVFCSITKQDNVVYGGELVNFELMKSAQGKPQAFNVRLIQEAILGSAEETVVSNGCWSHQQGKGMEKGFVHQHSATYSRGSSGKGAKMHQQVVVGDTGESYIGTIMSVRGNVGLVSCEHISVAYGMHQDVSVPVSLLEAFRIGSLVNFDLGFDHRGHPMASQTRVVLTGQSEAPPSHKQTATGKCYNGTIKSLGERHGFIECQSVHSLFEGSDTFFSSASAPGLEVGDMVNFELMVSDKGKPQAVKLAKVDPLGMTLSSTEFPDRSIEQVAFDSPGGLLGEADTHPFVGTIKSINEKFCFITSPEIVEQFGRDVFCSTINLAGQGVGQDVAFDVVLNDRGHPQARNVTSINKASWPVDGARMHEIAQSGGLQGESNELHWIAADETGQSGESFLGRIKSINDKFCFITSTEIAKQFGRDAFCSTVNLCGQTVGQEVLFDVVLNDRGQPQARNIRDPCDKLVMPFKPKEMPIKVPVLAPSGHVDPWGSSFAENSGLQYTGKVKSINDKFCFITSPELIAEFGRDVFCSTVNLAGQGVGHDVAFNVVLNDRGHPQARNVASLGIQPSTMHATGASEGFQSSWNERIVADEPGQSGEFHLGRIKSINDKFCFITSPEIAKQFGRDAFCSTVNLFGQAVGEEVLFDVVLNDKGQPQARNIRSPSAIWKPQSVNLKSSQHMARGGLTLEPEYGDAQESFPSVFNDHAGTIKSINDKFCFISSAEIVNEFGRDVFCSTVNLSGQVVGQDVLFDIVLNNRGQPQARNIRNIGERNLADPPAKRQKIESN